MKALHVGRHRPPTAARPVAPLARPLGPVEVECEALFTVLRHLEDGRSIADSWALGEIDAADLRTAARAAS